MLFRKWLLRKFILRKWLLRHWYSPLILSNYCYVAIKLAICAVLRLFFCFRVGRARPARLFLNSVHYVSAHFADQRAHYEVLFLQPTQSCLLLQLTQSRLSSTADSKLSTRHHLHSPDIIYSNNFFGNSDIINKNIATNNFTFYSDTATVPCSDLLIKPERGSHPFLLLFSVPEGLLCCKKTRDLRSSASVRLLPCRPRSAGAPLSQLCSLRFCTFCGPQLRQ